MNPLKMIISPLVRRMVLPIYAGEMIIFNGPGFKKDKHLVTE
jgi:hypothetical protein